MIEDFSFYLALVVLIVFLIMLSNKIKLAYPILLVLAGLIISFMPGVPVLKIEPELIFIIFLPPLLYDAAWFNSWKELWHWRRIIGSFAFVVVFLTAFSVAFVANFFIPGFTLALGFLLGGIVSPPDAVSAGAILKFVKVPKRVSSILEGESLLNDASSLIIFRFALISAITGQFIWYEAALSFIWMVIGGIGIGVFIGVIFCKTQKFFPTDANMDIILSLVTPYIIYITAEEFHASGILAVVSGSLYLSYNRHHFLSSSSRLRAETVWQSFIFLLNGLVFLLIGLDLPEITSGLKQEGISFYDATLFALLITLVLMLGRMLVAYGAVIVTKIASVFITVADKNPGNRLPFVLGWAGMRGVVSLAAALSIPVTLDDSPFPHRNLILYITFIVILATLVLQGTTLPFVIKKLRIPSFHDHLPKAETEKILRKELAKVSLDYLQLNAKESEYSIHLQKWVREWEFDIDSKDKSIPPDDFTLYKNILEEQRQILLKINRSRELVDEEIIRRFLHKIDLEEENLKQD